MSSRSSLALLRSLACLTATLIFAACGGGGGDGGGSVAPPPAVTISITPTTAAVDAGGTATFSATVANATNSAVTWSASGGSIVGNGGTATWTAPLSGGPFKVTATSVAAPTKAASATVTVRVASISVAVSAAPRAYFRGETANFTATVAGASPGRDSVTWSSTCGSVTPNGRNVSLVVPVVPGPCTVSARSTFDTTKVATSGLVVRNVLLVTSTDDVSDGACTFAHCSLREAILAANAAPDMDTVSLGVTEPPSASASSFDLPATVTLTSALPVLETSMHILGPGATQLTIAVAGSAGSPRRALTIRGAVSVSVSGVTITGGYIDHAGGVLVEAGADVLLDQVTMRNNTASDGPGGGAAVYGGSTLRIAASRFESNHSEDESDGNGGALYAGGQSILHVKGSVLRQNQAKRGGGVGADGAGITLEDVIIEDNTVASSGGGVSIVDGGSLTITGGVLRNNKATGSQGGALIAYGSSQSPANRVTLVMEDVRVENNQATRQGGALQLTRNVGATLTRVVIDGNKLTEAPTSDLYVFGGGIYGGKGVDLTLEQSTISNNRILSSLTNHDEDGGAGLAVKSSAAAASSLTIRNSTISGNESLVRGGGVYSGGATVTTITNSTISGNSAPAGGGVLATSPTILRNVTLMANRATIAGAGIRGDETGAIQLENTLLAGNLLTASGSNCSTAGGATITSLGHNLSDDVSCATFTLPGDLANTPSGAATVLADNSGPTPTHALLVGSAAINAGNAGTCTATDQRGVARVGVCDIGAVEFTAGSSARLSGGTQSSKVGAAFRRGASRLMSTRDASSRGEEAERSTRQRLP